MSPSHNPVGLQLRTLRQIKEYLNLFLHGIGIFSLTLLQELLPQQALQQP